MLYFDHASATPLESAARHAMTAAMSDAWGNPQSAHVEGRRARAVLERAAIQAAELIGCAPPELRLYPSATTALDDVLHVVLDACAGPVVTTAIEHPAVVQPLRDAERRGRELRWLPTPAGELGVPSPAMCADAAVLVLSALNHELGTAPDLSAWLAAAPSAVVVIDGVQAASWLPFAPWLDERCFVVIASHKLGGPGGAAALRCPSSWLPAWAKGREVPRVSPIAAAGFGAACELRRSGRDAALARARQLGRRLRDGLLAIAPEVHDDAGPSWLGPIVNVAVRGCEHRSLDAELDLEGLAVARGSACRRGVDEHSEVVARAHPDEPWRARSCVRFSLGWPTTTQEVDAALACFARRIVVTRTEELH